MRNDNIEMDGYRIAYTATGSPSDLPIILVHGLMSHRGVWTHTMEALKENFFCIAIDLPGFATVTNRGTAITPSPNRPNAC